MSKRFYYLDNCSTTEPEKSALSQAVSLAAENYGNPSSGHSLGAHAKDLLEEARENVARSLGANKSSVVFTSGGTEANSIVLNQFSQFYKFASSCEHSSVLRVADELVPVNKDGTINLNYLENRLSSLSKMSFVSVMLANHETGVILDPLKRLRELKERYNFVLHVDAVQGYGKIPLQLSADDYIDFLTISAHKVHGLKGIGALYINKRNSPPKPLFVGGSQERGVRPGTQNVLGAYNFGIIASRLQEWSIDTTINSARTLLEQKLADICDVNGSTAERVKNVTNLYFKDTHFESVSQLEMLLETLSENGLAASANSACKTGFSEPSTTLQAMFGENSERIFNSIRISFPVCSGVLPDLPMQGVSSYVDEIESIIRLSVNQCKEYLSEVKQNAKENQED